MPLLLLRLPLLPLRLLPLTLLPRRLLCLPLLTRLCLSVGGPSITSLGSSSTGIERTSRPFSRLWVSFDLVQD